MAQDIFSEPQIIQGIIEVTGGVVATTYLANHRYDQEPSPEALSAEDKKHIVDDAFYKAAIFGIIADGLISAVNHAEDGKTYAVHAGAFLLSCLAAKRRLNYASQPD